MYLNDILIYTEDPEQPHVEVMWWVLEQLRKYGFYANLKKCWFYEDEVRFLGFVVLAQGIKMEEKRIETVRDWPESQSVRDIQVFLSFANFYRRFIRNFRKIAAPLTLMFQTTGNNNLGALVNEHEEDQDATAGTVDAGSGRSIKNLLTAAKLAKSQKPNFAKANFGTDFLTPEAKEAFIHLRKAFTKAPILRYYNLNCHIRIETDASGYAIGGVLSQMISDQYSSGHIIHEDLISSKS